MMSEYTDDVMDGIFCMECGVLNSSDNGEVCQCGFPVLCESCYRSKPKKQQKNLSYWNEKRGDVVTKGV